MTSSATTSSGKPQVLTIGLGALGTLYSYILQAGGCEVTALARSNYELVSQSGIHIASSKFGEHAGWKPDRVVREPAEARDRAYDYVLCTSKCTPDYVPLSEIIRPCLAPPLSDDSQGKKKAPLLILIQNGVGIESEPYSVLYEKLRLVSGIVSCVAWVGCNVVDAGRRIEHGTLERLEMSLFPALPPAPENEQLDGEHQPTSSPASSSTAPSSGFEPVTGGERASLESSFRSFVQHYLSGGGGAVPVPDIQPARWKKLLWNAAWGGLSALARQPIAALIEEGSLHFSLGVVRRTMLEVLYVARACGYDEHALPAASVDDAIRITLKTYAPPRAEGQQAAGTSTGSSSGGGGDVAEPTSAAEHAALKRQADQSVAERSSADGPSSSASAPAKPPAASSGGGGGGLSAGFKPSILLDLEAGRPMETVPLFESVMERARLHGVETPRLDMIMASLRPSQVQAIERARQRARAPSQALAQGQGDGQGQVVVDAETPPHGQVQPIEGNVQDPASRLHLQQKGSRAGSNTTSPLMTPRLVPGGMPVPSDLRTGYF